MTSKKSYKIEYYNLKNQIGKGNSMDWILNFKEKEFGRPYYINQQTGEEVAAGSDIKLPYKRIFDKENGIDSLINEKTSSLISTVNLRNLWEIKLVNPVDWILNFKKEEDGRPYYINKEIGKEIAAGSGKKFPVKYIFDEKNGILHGINEKTDSLIRSVNFRNLWEIKPIEEVVNLPLPEINVNIRQISGSENDNELEKLIENINKYDPNYQRPYAVPNDWLGHGYGITTAGKIKEFVPNRFLLKGPRSRFMIVPMFYLEDINSNIELIGHIRDYISKQKNPLEFEKKKLEYLEEIIEKKGNFWLAISRFDIMVNRIGNVIKAHIDNAFGDHLKKGAGKIVTCFLVKYLKKIYPENKIEVTLKEGGLSGTAWSRHGFKEQEGLSSGVYGVSASHILNLEENERICNEALKEFDITEFLYYDLRK